MARQSCHISFVAATVNRFTTEREVYLEAVLERFTALTWHRFLDILLRANSIFGVGLRSQINLPPLNLGSRNELWSGPICSCVKFITVNILSTCILVGVINFSFDTERVYSSILCRHLPHKEVESHSRTPLACMMQVGIPYRINHFPPLACMHFPVLSYLDVKVVQGASIQEKCVHALLGKWLRALSCKQRSEVTTYHSHNACPSPGERTLTRH